MKDVHSNRAQSQELKSVQQYSTKLFLDIKLLAVQTSVHKGKKSFYGILIFFFSLSYGSSLFSPFLMLLSSKGIQMHSESPLLFAEKPLWKQCW